jgi:glycosyltransferase involved in cell wall biosynthesis
VDVFVTICKEDVRSVKEIGAINVPVAYLPNCIDIKAVQARVRRLKTVKEADNLQVLFLGGSDSIRKGIKDFASAIPTLAQKFSHVRFRIVGVPGHLVNSLLPPEYLEHCIVENWATGQAKYLCLAEADIFVLPTYGEGMPIAILEAMGAGLPTVASRIAAIPDMITGGAEGILIPPGDVAALIDALSTLIESASMRQEMGRKAVRRAMTNYDLPVGVEQLRRLYQGLLGKSV